LGNDKGGYSCPRAWPYPCYIFDNATLRAECDNCGVNNGADELSAGVADDLGILDPLGIRTPQMQYYQDSGHNLVQTYAIRIVAVRIAGGTYDYKAQMSKLNLLDTKWDKAARKMLQSFGY